MLDPHEEQPGPLSRIVRDPLSSRRVAAVTLLIATPLAGVAHAADWGFATGMLAALCWALSPFIAVGIGHGDAFFIQYGRARRRTLLTLVAGMLLALASCVVLAGIGDSADNTRRTVTEGISYGMLYLSLTLTLASLIALILGYGKDYVSERIMRMTDDDW